RFGVDRPVVFDAPGIDPAFAERTDQFAAGRARDQQLVALGPVPDDLDQVGQVSGIAEFAPDLAVGTLPAIVSEIAAVDLVGQRLILLRTRAAQSHHLGDDDVGG